jgi:hypothetical protein
MIADLEELEAGAMIAFTRVYREVALQAWKAAIGAKLLTIEQENEFVIWWNGWARNVK